MYPNWSMKERCAEKDAHDHSNKKDNTGKDHATAN
jgi:hypothetical protein